VVLQARRGGGPAAVAPQAVLCLYGIARWLTPHLGLATGHLRSGLLRVVLCVNVFSYSWDVYLPHVMLSRGAPSPDLFQRLQGHRAPLLDFAINQFACLFVLSLCDHQQGRHHDILSWRGRRLCIPRRPSGAGSVSVFGWHDVNERRLG
jgi:hypothetical protein